MKGERIDRIGEHRTALEKNKRIILKTQDICGICGQPVDKKIHWPDPLSPTVDHIIPVAKGGHPSDLSNLQLAHNYCNTIKSDRLLIPTAKSQGKKGAGNKKIPAPSEDPGQDPESLQPDDWTDNDNLPLHCNWLSADWL